MKFSNENGQGLIEMAIIFIIVIIVAIVIVNTVTGSSQWQTLIGALSL